MRLPDAVEQAIRTIEAEYEARKGQHAGVPRLRELRSAIETALRPTRDADAELRRLSEAATPGPWRVGGTTVDGDGCSTIEDATGHSLAWCGNYTVKQGELGQDDHNAAFIVAAVNAVRERLT